MNTELKVDLNGNQSDGLVDWKDIQVIATFENGNAQPNVTINSEFTFVDEYAEEISSWIQNGFITEGIPLKFIAQNSNGTISPFDGVIDFFNGFKKITPNEYKCKIKPQTGLNRLSDRAEGLTFQSLKDQNLILPTDIINVPYVIEKEMDFFEVAMLSFAIYQMQKAIREQVEKLAEAIANATAHLTGGVSGSVSAAVYAVATAAINAAFLAFMLIQFSKMVQELLSYVYSPVRFHKAIRLKTLIERASDYLGYQYNSSIPEITNDQLVYMSSKNNLKQDTIGSRLLNQQTIVHNSEGVPQPQDYGFTFGEILTLVNKAFGAKIAIKNNVIEQHSLNSSWWIQNSTYQMPDVLVENEEYNTEELIGTRLLRFRTDPMDFFTLDNYDGTVTEAQTLQSSVNNIQNQLIKGLEDVDLAVALGSRKDGLNFFEKRLLDLAKVADLLSVTFGGQPKWANKINARVGMLKLSKDTFNVPKLMKMNSANKLDSNHREVWSSLYLWNNYVSYYSMVGNNTNQWKVYDVDQKVPFGMDDFLSVIDNCYFLNDKGVLSKMDKVIWEPNNDCAKITYRVNEKYTNNLIIRLK